MKVDPMYPAGSCSKDQPPYLVGWGVATHTEERPAAFHLRCSYNMQMSALVTAGSHNKRTSLIRIQLNRKNLGSRDRACSSQRSLVGTPPTAQRSQPTSDSMTAHRATVSFFKDRILSKDRIHSQTTYQLSCKATVKSLKGKMAERAYFRFHEMSSTTTYSSTA